MGKKIGTETSIEAKYRDYSNVIIVKVKEASIEIIPNGLSFKKQKYFIIVGKEKKIILRLKIEPPVKDIIISQVSSNHREIIIKGNGQCKLLPKKSLKASIGNFRILGRQLNAKGLVTADIKGFKQVTTEVRVIEKEESSGIKIRFEPVEDDFGKIRYKWDDKDPYLLLIGAKQHSVRKYLGKPENNIYPGISSSLYHIILAEIIAEALAFRITEQNFIRDGQDRMLEYSGAEYYYYKHFSDFINIAHDFLVADSKQ